MMLSIFNGRRFVILFMLMAICAGTVLHAQSDEEKLARLDAHLVVLGNESRTARLISGWTMVGGGVAIGGLGIIMTEAFYEGAEWGRVTLDLVFGLTGGLMAGGGVLILVLPTEPELLAQEFGALPQRSDDEIRAKVERGEVMLESLANRSRDGRIIGGIILLASGVAEIVLYLTVGPDVFGSYYYDDSALYSMIGTAVSSCATGLLSLILKSRPELEWDSYRSWRQNRRREADAQTPGVAPVDFVLLPTPAGASFRLSFSF